jgi:coenzyme F420-0:L-glutamate ligase/coenzyme F420-1:gamma-L-glutamate ligase
MTAPSITCAEQLTFTALRALPLIEAGDDLAAAIGAGLQRTALALCPGDVLVVASKLVSRAEGRFVDLGTLRVSSRARAVARRAELDPRVVELVLAESVEISRLARGVLITRNRHGVVCANAGVDLSNARPGGAPAESGPWALGLPEAPDDSAERLRQALAHAHGVSAGVIISDSVGRPFRLGSVGVALGLAGLPALWDQRGSADLFGMRLEHTVTALADQIATAAELVAGQAAEARGVVHVRGLRFPSENHRASELVRPAELDLYAALPHEGGTHERS